EPRHLQVGRLWEFGRRCDAQVCEGRSRAAEHQPLRNLRASRTFERVALKCDLRRWIAPLLHLHETHLSATCQALHRMSLPLVPRAHRALPLWFCQGASACGLDGNAALGPNHVWTKDSARVTADAFGAPGRTEEVKALREKYGVASSDDSKHP